MPAQSNKLIELRESTGPGELPYISKSRISKWVTCPESFNYSYIKGYKEPENRYMRRGTAVHEAYEDYYENLETEVRSSGSYPRSHDLISYFRDPVEGGWADHTEPYITNFLAYEHRRMEYCKEQGLSPDDWLPVAVEAEEWLTDPLDYGEAAIPWMGYADAIYQASTFPQVEDDDGVVIVDFKTGKVPDKKYRDEGIYLEGEYYAMLFASEWDVAAVAGYYPKADELIVSPLKESRREKIEGVVRAMQEVSGTDPGHLEIDEQPLCFYGEGEGEQCAYYDMCESTWGEPLKHADKTRAMNERGFSKGEIASELGCDYGAVNYAFYKLGIS